MVGVAQLQRLRTARRRRRLLARLGPEALDRRAGLRAVLIDRDPAKRHADPVETVAEVLRGGEDVIFFPEGTRNLTDAALLPLKSGIFHLANAAPMAEIVPAWILNLDRILPKGSVHRCR